MCVMIRNIPYLANKSGKNVTNFPGSSLVMGKNDKFFKQKTVYARDQRISQGKLNVNQRKLFMLSNDFLSFKNR